MGAENPGCERIQGIFLQPVLEMSFATGKAIDG